MVDFSGAPTTVGSIVGYLKLNKDDWDAKLKEAKAQADELGKDSPDVHLRTNADEVLAKLEAVRVAAGELDGKSAALDITTSETTRKRTLTSSDVAATGGGSSAAAKIDAVSAAQRKLADAELRSATAMDRVKVAQDALTAAESRYQAAADAATAAEDASWRAQQSGVSSAKAKEDALKALQQATVRVDQAYAQLSAREAALSKAQRDAAQVIDQSTAAYDNLQQAMRKVEAVQSAAASVDSRVMNTRKALAAAEADAASSMDKAKTAQDALTAAQQRSAQASSEAKTALDSVRSAQESLSSETSDVTAALKNLRSAQSDAAKAAKTAQRAEKDAQSAYKDAAKTVDESTTAYEKYQSALKRVEAESEYLAKSTDKAAGSNKSLLAGLGPMAYGFGALAGLAGPLAESIVGLGGAFTLEGAAGVTAVLGIRNAMAEGTTIGQQYSAGLEALKGDLAQIEQTSARGILSGFLNAEQQIKNDLPELNADMGTFAGLLGRTGDNTLAGVLSAVHTLNPLFQEGAGILEVWTQQFKVWAAGGGLKQFAADAEQELPRVMTTLQSLMQDVIMLGADLAPVGNDILDIADAIQPLLQGLNALNAAQAKFGQGNPVFRTAATAIGDVLNPIQLVSHALGSAQPLIDQVTGSAKLHADAVKAVAKAQFDAANAAQFSASKYGMNVSAYQTAAAAAQAMTKQTQATTQALQLENDAAGLLTNALTILNGGSLSLAQAQTGVGQATNSAAAAFKQNGSAIDGNSAAALANQAAIEQQVSAAQQMAEAQAKATGKTQDGIKAYQDSKTALENELKAQGDLTPAVQAYIDKLYDLNNLKVAPTKLELDDQASAGVNALIARLNSIPRQVTINASIQGTGAGIQMSTTGSKVIARAAGGAVTGPGTGTSDSIHALLSNGEHVLSTADVNAMGGQQAVYAMRKALHASGGGYLRVGSPPAATAPSGARQVMVPDVIVNVTNKTGATLDDLIDIRINTRERMRAIQTMAGPVR